jgi:transcriptional regulator with XRE-family HTH domain
MIREMHPVEFRQALEALGLTQTAVAKLLGLSDRMARHYARGDYAVPPPIAALLRLMVKTKTTAAKLAAL